MKKLTVFICALLILTLVSGACALGEGAEAPTPSPSPKAVPTAGLERDPVPGEQTPPPDQTPLPGETPLPPANLVTFDINPNSLLLPALRETVINGMAWDEGLRVSEVLAPLEGSLPEDAEDWALASPFRALCCEDGGSVSFDEGRLESLSAAVRFDALLDASPESLADFCVLVIDGDTGEACLLPLSAEGFDPQAGEITVPFPCLGVFCLVQSA